MKKKPTIAIIGLGYIGLPLAVAFAEKYKVIGFDINSERVQLLKTGEDKTLEISKEKLLKVLQPTTEIGFSITDDSSMISEATVYIITVPTPTDKNNRPELTPL